MKDAARGTAGPAAPFELEVLHRLLGYQLKIAHKRVYRSFDDHLSALGLTPGHFGLLLVVGANPDLTQTALADALACNRSLIVRTIDQLQKQGLVVRRAVPLDRRSYAIRATRKGSRLVERLKRDVLEHEQRVTRRLSRHEVHTLLSLLRRLNSDCPPGEA